MSRKVGFVRTTLLGGLVALVPVALLVTIAATAVPVVLEVAEILGEFLPFGPLVNLLLALVAAIVLALALCFLAGLALLTGPGAALRDRVDGFLGKVIPLYGAARRLAERVTGVEGEDFQPVTVDLHGSGVLSVGVVVERISDGRYAVFVPHAPTAAFGSVYLVPENRLERIDAPMTEVMGVVTEWGVGATKLFPGRSE